MVNVHFKGVYFLTQTLLPLIADGGRIVNLSSGLTRITYPGYAAYAAVKGAVEVLSVYMAKELGRRGIAVNTVAPGAIETDFGGGVVRDNPALNKTLAEQTALGRTGLPDDIGPMLAGMLSEDNRWVNARRRSNIIMCSARCPSGWHRDNHRGQNAFDSAGLGVHEFGQLVGCDLYVGCFGVRRAISSHNFFASLDIVVSVRQRMYSQPETGNSVELKKPALPKNQQTRRGSPTGSRPIAICFAKPSISAYLQDIGLFVQNYRCRIRFDRMLENKMYKGRP